MVLSEREKESNCLANVTSFINLIDSNLDYSTWDIRIESINSIDKISIKTLKKKRGIKLISYCNIELLSQY